MFIVNHATLFLLITYHWHASWAVSTWPSGGPGIAAEVNGSPTDAWLNIPVVKRTSNQAELANELPLPGRPVGTRSVVVVVDADSPSELVEYLAVGPSERTHREYANRTTEKYLKAIIPTKASRKMMIERISHHNDRTESPEWERTHRKNDEREQRKEERAKERLAIVRKSLIPAKELAAMNESIGKMNSPSIIRPWMFTAGRWLDYEQASMATYRKRQQRDDPARLKNNSAFKDFTGTENVREKINRTNGPMIDALAINLMGIFGIHAAPDQPLTSSLRSKRQAPLVDAGRINNSKVESRRPNEKDDKATSDYDTRKPPNGTPLLSTLESLEHSSLHDERNKPSGISSGITSPLGVTKLLDSSRLHQQSRNTKPRTIVQHLRGSTITGQTRGYHNSPRLSRSQEFYEPQFRNVEPRFSTRPLLTDPRYRRPPTQQQFANFPKSNTNPNQLRFIPLHNGYGKNVKSFGPQDPNDSAINEVVDPSQRDQLTQTNIANLSNFDVEQIDNLQKSLGGVFDRHFSPPRVNILPNVRAILPKQVFVAPPRLIYNTKILPAPFSLQNFFENANNVVNVNEDTDEKINHSSSHRNDGILNGQKVNINLDKRPTIPVREDSKESVTSSEKFVTPLPPRTSQVSFGVNQSEVPLVSTLSDEVHRVRGLEEMENPSRVPEYETFQRDKDEPRVNHKSPSETGVKDHSGNTRSSYDNSGSTYASKDQTGAGNVDHSPVIEAINDEYPNHQNTRHPDVSNIKLGVRIPTSPMHGRQSDGNYNRGSNKWRGNDDNNHPRYIAKYSFGYLVDDDDSHNDFGHEEMRDEGITKGRYHVRLPDGRIQKVNYQVDDNGYRAVVSYQRDSTQ